MIELVGRDESPKLIYIFGKMKYGELYCLRDFILAVFWQKRCE